jgi:cell division protein FtsA
VIWCSKPLASSYAVLEKDEKELGVALIDMGGGTTDIALYFDESIRHTAVVGLGRSKRDQRHCHRYPHADRQGRGNQKTLRLRIFSSLVKTDEYISVPGVGGQGAAGSIKSGTRLHY